MSVDRKVALQTFVQVVRRPRLWLTAVRQLWRIRRSDWYRKLPFLPVPDTAYLNFRIYTAYGDEGGQQKIPIDVITYLEWCKSWQSADG